MGKKGGGGGNVTGFKYSLSMLMGLCRGPVNEIVDIKVGDLEAWSGSVTGNTQFEIDAPELFGGDTKEGGIKGTVDAQFGAPDQDLTGSNFFSIVGGVLSSLRGVATLFYTGLVCSNSPYPKKWAVRARRSTAGWHQADPWYPDEAVVLLDDGAGHPIHAMNPSHMLLECLTNPVWGRGLPRAALDEPSFISAANTLCRENFGLCMGWTRSASLADFMQSIINHVGGAIYTDRTTGLQTIRLLRKDYVVSDLPQFSYETGLLSIDDDQTTAPDNSHSEIVVNWLDPVTNNQRQTRVQNLAGTQANQTVTSTKVDYPGLPTAGLAARVAQRDLMAQGSGIKRYKIRLDRRGRKVTPAGVFRLHVPDRGIDDMVLRAGNIEEGPIGSQSITITAVQDVFSLETTTYLAPPEHAWVPPDKSVNEVAVRRVSEITYRDLVRVMTTAELATVSPTEGDPVIVGLQPTGLSTAYELMTAATGEGYADHGMFGWTPTGLLANTIGLYDTSMMISNGNRLNLIGTLPVEAWVDDEIVEVTSYDDTTGVMTIGRGCVDTIPQTHPANTRVWFPERAQSADGREYTVGEDVRIKLLTRTNSGVLALADAPEDTWTVIARQGKPYAPGDFKIGGTRFGDVVTVLGDIEFTWAHRDRITQADHMLVHEDASTGPEAGVTYTVRIYAGEHAYVTGPHRYWRLHDMTNVLALPGFTAVGEIALCAVIGGPSVATGGVASASTTSIGTPSLAFDGDTGTQWMSNQLGPYDWIQYDLGAGNDAAILSVVITPASGFENHAPNRFTLQSSDDGVTWTDLHTFLPATWTAGVSQTFDAYHLLRTTTGIADDNWTYTTTMASDDAATRRIVVELEAERDDIVSYQHYHWLFSRAAEGYGNDYGNNYSG